MGVAKERAGVEFALDRFAYEGGRLVVEGRWYGVLGRRFVRPVLHLEGRRRLIAVMDHKPWPAEEGMPWTAAFAHTGEAGRARLQVAPDVAIDLPSPGPAAGDGTPRPAQVERPPIAKDLIPREEREAAEEAAQAEAARAPQPEPEPEPAPEPRSEETEPPAARQEAARRDADRYRVERDEARAEAESLRTERDQVRDEAEELRRADQKTRSAMEELQRERDEARGLVERLRAEGNDARAATGRALAERDSIRRDLETLRRTGRPAAPTGPVIAPRPMPFHDRPRRRWTVRATALTGLGALIAAVLYLLLG
jgi:hypothetical protein